MADFIRKIFRDQNPSNTPVPANDDGGKFVTKSSQKQNSNKRPLDFADFAGAPDPSPASIASVASSAVGPPTFPTFSGNAVPYTKWYRVWERTSLNDFTQEGFILGFI